MSLLPQRGQDEEANEYLDRILPELNEILENSLSGTAFVKDGKVFVKVVSPHNAADKDLELGKMLTNAANIVTIDTEKLEDAAITTAKLANGSLDLTKFASDIEPVQVVSNLNSISSPSQGQVAFLTSDNSLYRYTGGAWTKAVPTSDLTGTIGSTQIADNAVTSNKIVSNAITATKISDNAITAGKIASNAVTAGSIASNAIIAGKIAAGAIGTNELAANAITSAKLATNELITSSAQIGDATILTAAIGDAQITNAKVNDLAANKITAGTLAADRIGANSITSGKIAADAITTDKIAANAITASEIATDAVTTDKLAANSITSAKLATSNLITQSAQINDGIITNAKINDLNASKINAGIINSSRINSGSIAAGIITTNGIALNAVTQVFVMDTGLGTGVPASLSWSPAGNSSIYYNAFIIAEFQFTGSTNSGASSSMSVTTTGGNIGTWTKNFGITGITAANSFTLVTAFANNNAFLGLQGGYTYSTAFQGNTNLGAINVEAVVFIRAR